MNGGEGLVSDATHCSRSRVSLAMLTYRALCGDAAHGVCSRVGVAFLSCGTGSGLALLTLHASLSGLSRLSGITGLAWLSGRTLLPRLSGSSRLSGGACRALLRSRILVTTDDQYGQQK